MSLVSSSLKDVVSTVNGQRQVEFLLVLDSEIKRIANVHVGLQMASRLSQKIALMLLGEIGQAVVESLVLRSLFLSSVFTLVVAAATATATRVGSWQARSELAVILNISV
jgi:hypothetical protein